MTDLELRVRRAITAPKKKPEKHDQQLDIKVAQAVQNRDIAQLRQLFLKEADPTGKTPEANRDYLHTAVLLGYAKAFKLLWENEPSSKDINKGRYLHPACFFGHLELVEYLLTIPGINVLTAEETGVGEETPIQEAISSRNINVIKRLLQEKTIFESGLNVLTREGSSLLALACAELMLDVFKMLIETNKITPETINHPIMTCDEGVTIPLLYLVISNYTPQESLACVQMLVEHGADIDARGPEDEGGDLAEIAKRKGRTQIEFYLKQERKKRAEQKQVNELMAKKDVAGLRALLGKNYLGMAVKYGIDVFSLLWQHEPSTKNINDASFYPFLVLAAGQGNLPMVKWLLEQPGININACDKNGDTPIIEACLRGSFETIQYLINKGADLNIVNKSGYSVLLRACDRATQPSVIFKLLLNIGQITSTTINTPIGDPNHLEKQYPLLYCVISKIISNKLDVECLTLLLDNGADVNAKYKGQSLVDYARQAKREDIAQILLSRMETVDANERSSRMMKNNQAVLMATSTDNHAQHYQDIRSRNQQGNTQSNEARFLPASSLNFVPLHT